MFQSRRSGILCHITCLPSPYGIGDLGPETYEFVDFLALSGQSYWQILPLNPTEIKDGNSPYSSYSAFAGNPLLISPDILLREGYLDRKDLDTEHKLEEGRVNFPEVAAFKQKLFTKAYQIFAESSDMQVREDFGKFCHQHQNWLNDFALFVALKQKYKGKSWSEWPAPIRDRDPEALDEVERELSETIEKEKFLQYLFFRQWEALKGYCRNRGIQIIGDLPFYISYESADVWSHPSYFRLDEEKQPEAVAGVPPDYFSETGQLWGMPIYRWDQLQQRHFSWWMHRVEHNMKLYDLMRIDHFRAFSAYWEVPAEEETAINGKWRETPGRQFLANLKAYYGQLPFIAEDLGYIDQGVIDLMDEFDLPGMRLLQFAFGEKMAVSDYIPHNHIRDCVVYNGTHDNNTVKGWFEDELTQKDRQRLEFYVNKELTPETAPNAMLHLAMMSVSNLCILRIQDLLGLGEEALMNKPGTSKGNWEWRLKLDQLSSDLGRKLYELTEGYGRLRK